MSRVIVDFFNDSCSENAVKECDELKLSVPDSDVFDAEEFDQFCRYFSLVV